MLASRLRLNLKVPFGNRVHFDPLDWPAPGSSSISALNSRAGSLSRDRRILPIPGMRRRASASFSGACYNLVASVVFRSGRCVIELSTSDCQGSQQVSVVVMHTNSARVHTMNTRKVSSTGQLRCHWRACRRRRRPKRKDPFAVSMTKRPLCWPWLVIGHSFALRAALLENHPPSASNFPNNKSGSALISVLLGEIPITTSPIVGDEFLQRPNLSSSGGLSRGRPARSLARPQAQVAA